MNATSMSSTIPTIKCEDTSPSPVALGSDGESGTYNLSVNVNLSAAMINMLTAEGTNTTLRTPEIVNDVITMTNPLDQYNYEKNSSFKNGSGNDSNSSMSNGSSATSPSSSTPPSIQKTCSELIKAGLKLSIESKRKMSGSDTDVSVKRLKKEESDEDYDSSHTQQAKNEGLTPEDEERRRRRRERNKIAATKCRMKKRERTVNLVTESEVLENQNIDLKAQLKDLEVQKRQLIDMLSLHAASCVKNNSTTRQSPTMQYNMIRSYDSPSTFPSSFEAHSPYIRPESANILASSYTCATPIGDSSVDTISSLDSIYPAQQLIEQEYNRPDSVLSLTPTSDPNFVTTDGFLPKATNLLIPIDAEQEYYDPDVNYNLASNQQCHTYPGSAADAQTKINNGLNDGCLV
ncbi:activating transcription factor 3 isoform X4 [Bombyx mandarina]|uniref:BZIP domain-containing protein n=2 Tax=Bombyx TaxID=7090 RepID=A0A8R2GAN7_BOMMO|nr:activating transcription factor 3 isoform X2 [Bombyx mori]XP_028027482.1 activating transcription factor 3 isoform X3 [Bombyx mandarina]XP_028027483.1 activating transcription factor 3 isoform X4 [Bombyx mandarina]